MIPLVAMAVIHPSAQTLAPNIQIGNGSIICAGAVLTTNIKIGKHVHVNLNGVPAKKVK